MEINDEALKPNEAEGLENLARPGEGVLALDRDVELVLSEWNVIPVPLLCSTEEDEEEEAGDGSCC